MPSSDNLRDLRIVSFESRRAKEVAEMIRRQGGEPLSAPAVREVPRDGTEPALDFGRQLRGGEVDIAIFLTGVGTNFLIDALAPEMSRAELARYLATVTTVARGPKPAAVLRGLGITANVTVPEPNTWRELIVALDQHVRLPGLRVAVQEYGEENADLIEALKQRGARVVRVPLYRWELPEDVEPLRKAIEEILESRVQAVMFTSAIQVKHLFRVAGADAQIHLQMALNRTVVASVGPICSQAIRDLGVGVDLEPEHPKLGHLVSLMAEKAREILKTK